MSLTLNETVLSALLHGNLLERDASVNNAVAHDAARQIIATRHYAIISPSRDVLGHRHGGDAGAHEALLRTAHAAARNGLPHPLHPDHTAQEAHRIHNYGVNSAMVATLRGQPHVRALGGYKEAGTGHAAGHIPTEGSFVIHGHHAGSRMSLDTATALGHHFGQDSIIYSGPETSHEPRLVSLHYHPDGSPKFGSYSHVAAFDPARVRAVTPGDARRTALGGGTVAFTHAYDPHGDPLRHALPHQDLNQIAFKLVGRTARPHVADVSH